MSEYFDKFARHMIDTEFYAQEEEAEFEDFMDSLKRKLLGVIGTSVISSKKEYNRIIKECEKIINDEVDDYEEELNEKRQEQAKKERDWLNEMMKVAYGLALASSFLKMDKAVSAPINKTDTVDTFSEGLKSKVRKNVTTPLLSSYIFGSSGSAVSDSVAANIDRTTKVARADVHTSVTSVQRSVLQLMAPKKLKYQYISMLDEKTCEVCGSYSGEVFDSLDDAPSLPLHDRCRCYYLPVEEAEDEPTYEEWLKSQPDSVVYKILGPSRYALYKSGVSVKKFTSDGHLLTLKELYKDKKD